MHPRFMLMVFVACLLLNVTGLIINCQDLVWATKPLLLTFLAFYFQLSTEKIAVSKRIWVLIALALSWIGDIFLMLPKQGILFLVSGVTAFLLAHLSYIFFFYRILKHEKVKHSMGIIILVLIIYILSMLILTPNLGVLKFFVWFYGLVLCILLEMAIHFIYIKEKKAGYLIAGGSLLFTASSILFAINRFVSPFPYHAVYVIVLYGTAQYMIVEGIIRYIRFAYPFKANNTN